jgi:ribonucleoside-triphosphate reductase
MACISLETAQNEMHGGQAIPAFDFYLAPFVRFSLKHSLHSQVNIMENLMTLNNLVLK